MASMTVSQFKTFRADVQRAAREEIRAQMNDIQNQIFRGLVNEARRVAASTARKDLQRMQHEITTRINNVEIAQSMDNIERADITDSLENLESRLDAALSRLKNVESEVTRNALHRLEFKTGEVYITNHDPRKEHGKYLTGDKYIAPDGEQFWWYLGQWRRLSELEGFRDGLRDCGINL